MRGNGDLFLYIYNAMYHSNRSVEFNKLNKPQPVKSNRGTHNNEQLTDLNNYNVLLAMRTCLQQLIQ